MDCKGEAKKEKGKWVCHARKCPHRKPDGGCKLGKISMTCERHDCRWNVLLRKGVYGCRAMDVHLDADGCCHTREQKK